MAKFNFRQLNASVESSIQGLARIINAVQGNIEPNIKQLQQIQFLDGNLLELSLNSGGTTVVHKLGRQPQGYIVLRSSAASTFYDNIGDGSTDREFIITTSAATNVKLWVF